MFKGRKKGKGKSAGNPLARRVVRGDDSPTQPLPAESEAATRRINVSSEAETRILGESSGETTLPADPPVAVLLIMAGPGAGALLPVGYGVNRLGRDPGQRIRLDFGDQRVSRADHARVSYDGEGKRFYLQHGAGSSLTYLNGDPVLEPLELQDGARIKVGDTQLLFRILLDDGFDWLDHSRPDD